MSERKRERSPAGRAPHPRTTPAHAPGESGDEEARREAEEAVADRGATADREDAGGHAAKTQRPGKGREEQARERH
ncbi:hypothetical protein ACFVU3_04890 [Streptomyces sp. NPDC058052]|uniref:hypothetical protein n=1 Tax=Streptomyces sp. NPDC058052 TaxID=3346316 RepID=UPI0036E7DF27